MSWCGGGVVKAAAGVGEGGAGVHGDTLWAGGCRPSPGLAPCAILICRSVALTRYSLVTPKRPLATCLMALLRRGSLRRSLSSPPSPVLLLAPIEFIAIANVSCASAEIEP